MVDVGDTDCDPPPVDTEPFHWPSFELSLATQDAAGPMTVQVSVDVPGGIIDVGLAVSVTASGPTFGAGGVPL